MNNKSMTRGIVAPVLSLLSVLVMSCGLLSHNADDIINDMRDARNAQYVNVGSGLLGLGRLILPSLSEAGLGVNSVQLLDLSKCDVNVREKFRKRIQDLYKGRYYEEVLTSQRDYGQKTILVRRNGQYVSEIVIANADNTSDVMLLITGRINTANLERIINDHSNYFDKL